MFPQSLSKCVLFGLLLIMPLLFCGGLISSAWAESASLQYSTAFLNMDLSGLPPAIVPEVYEDGSIEVLDNSVVCGGAYRMHSGTTAGGAKIYIGSDLAPEIYPFGGGKTVTMKARVRVGPQQDTVMCSVGFYRCQHCYANFTDFAYFFCRPDQNQGMWKAFISDDERLGQFPMGCAYDTNVMPSASEWQEMKIVLTASAASFYIDGVLQHTFPSSSTPVPNETMLFVVGAGQWGGTQSNYIEISHLEISQH